MLKHTFIHVPGIGPITEQKLWAQGFLSWQEYLDRSQCRLPLTLRIPLDQYLEESAQALNAEDGRYFEVRLPAGEVWRIYPEFADKVAFLDIETTGLQRDTVTPNFVKVQA